MTTTTILKKTRIDDEPVWATKEVPVVKFKAIPDTTARELIGFVDARNVGKTISVDGETYTLDYISSSTSSFHRSRGISVYYRVGRSIVRISDHWSTSNGNGRSRKLNCGRIGDAFWEIDNKNAPLDMTYRAGKYPHRVLAGRAGLTALNKSVPHWKDN